MLASRTELLRRPAAVLFFAAILTATVSGTANWAIDPPRADEPPRGVVLPAAEAVEIGMQCWGTEEPHPESFRGWEPSPAEIAHLEALLPAFLRSVKTPHDFQPLHEYYRRYSGVIKNGKKTVCINFFHYAGIQSWIDFDKRNGKVATPEDYLRSGITVEDGGAYYFTAQFDVESDSFNLIMFNGNA